MDKKIFGELAVTVLIGVISLIIVILKKKKQLGKIWEEPVHATVSIKDKNLKCSHCGHEKFSKREGLLTTSWLMLFRISFWNYSAPCYSCQNCGFLHWFIRPEEKANFIRDSED